MIRKRPSPPRYAGIDVPQNADASTRAFMEGVKERLEQHTGARGNPKDRFVTMRDLETAGLARIDVKNSYAQATGLLGSQGQATSVSDIDANYAALSLLAATLAMRVEEEAYPAVDAQVLVFDPTDVRFTRYPVTMLTGTRSYIDEEITADWSFSGYTTFDAPAYLSTETDFGAAEPALAFSEDEDTGVYWIGANNFGFSTGGTLRWDVNTTRTLQNIQHYIAMTVPDSTTTSLLRIDASNVSASDIDIFEVTAPVTTGSSAVGLRVALWDAYPGSGTARGFRWDLTQTGSAAAILTFTAHNLSDSGSEVMRFVGDRAQSQYVSGSASVPPVSFSDATATGLFYDSANARLGVTLGGTYTYSFGTDALRSNNPVWAGAGSASIPGFTFAGDSDTGTYSAGTNILGFATAGSLRFQFGASGQFGIGGATYGSAGDIFISGGASAAPSWLARASLFANPAASVGLAAVNGTATTAMRSDAAPAIDQGIVPTWTGIHTFNNTVVFGGVARLKAYTVATLPAGTQGDTAYVTDALAPVFLAVLVGGGAIVTKAFYDGTNWVAG